MSVLANEREYQQVLADLAEVQVEDAQVTALRFNSGARSRNKHFQQYWVTLYLRYLRLAQRLSTLMDGELQPQKLGDLRTMLNSCIGRMLEAKDAVVRNCGDYLALDEVLLDMKLAPEQADIPIPSYILEDRGDEVAVQRNYIASLQAHYAETEPEAPVSQALQLPNAKADPTKALPPSAATKTAAAAASGAAAEGDEGDETDRAPPITFDSAVRLLQACERGRQARQRVTFQLLLHKQQQYALTHGKDFSTVTGKDKAATIVQKVVLGYLERKRAAERYKREKEFLGLAPTAATFSEEERLTAELRAQDRKARQRINQAELRQKALELESGIKAKEGPKTMEVMLDEVLMRMAYARMESKDGAIVELPPAEEGGSLKLLDRMPRPPSAAKRRKSSSAAVGGAAGIPGAAASSSSIGAATAITRASGGSLDSTANSGRGATAALRRRSTVRGKEDELLAPAMPPSTFWAPMKEGEERYEKVWRPRFEQSYVEGGDLDQKADEEELRRQLLQGPRGIMSELRATVDQLVAMEVTNLKAKLQAEADAKKKKKKGKRKAKRALRARKPKLKDPAKGVDLETSINTAVYENKLQLPPPTVRLCDFVGEENVTASSQDRALRTQAPDEETRKKWLKILRNWNEGVEKAMGMSQAEFTALFEAYAKQASWLKDPSAAEIRRAVGEYAVLPLGSQIIHDLAPNSKALLFYGLRGTGKTMLAYALCNETGANFFNLSPANFPTTKGLVKMIQLVFYVARMKAPSVIYIDGIEKVFPGKKIKGLPGPPGAAGKKKKKKSKKKNPLLVRGKKMKKELLKGLASILPHERVLLVAATAEPWALDATAAATHFQHGIYLPTPDYATRLSLLRQFIRGAIRGDERAGASARATTLAVPGDMAADGYEQLAMLTDGFTTGQLKQLVSRSLSVEKVRRVLHSPLTAKDFLHTLARMRAPATWERQLMDYFQLQLPFYMRRANAVEDFKETEEEMKKRKRNSVAKKPKAAPTAESVSSAAPGV